jgi:hypothetical protein
MSYSALMQLAVRREQDRLAELVALFTAIAHQGPAPAALAAFVLADSGGLEEAALRLDAASDQGFSDVPDDLSWPVATGAWAEVAAMLCDRDAAARLHDLHTPYDGLACATGGLHLGPTARLLARLEDVLGSAADADRHYAEAIEQSESVGSPVWRARCQLDWAASRLERGDHHRGEALIDRADATIGSLALPRLQRQSAELRDRLR